MVSRRDLLNWGAFSGLSASELDEIAKLCVQKAYDAGTTVFKEGDPASHFYLVEEGKVALEMNLPAESKGSRKRVTVDIVTQGEPMGWSALVEPYHFTLSSTCLDHVRVTAIDAVRLRNLLDKNPQIGYRVLKGLVEVVSSRLDLTRRVLTSERAQGGST